MKVLFIYKGRYHVRETSELEYLSAISKKFNHTTNLFYDSDVFGITDNVYYNKYLNKIFNKNVIKIIKNYKPDVIVCSCTLNNYKWIVDNARRIKLIIDIPIVFVGFFSSLIADQIMQSNVVDFVLVGRQQWEGLLSVLESKKNKNIHNIKNLWHRYDGKIVFNGRDNANDLNNLPFPDKSLFEDYVNNNDSYVAYTSIGCVNSCSYCEEGNNGYFLKRDASSVINELMVAKKKYNFKEIIFKDSCINIDKRWLRKFLFEYKKKVDVPFKCFCTVVNFDDETAMLLKISGCYCIEFGIQTWNEKIRKILSRFETNEQVMKAFKICDKINLMYDIDHMFGLPGENSNDHILAVKKYSTLKCLNRVKVHNLVYFPKLPITEYALRSGYINREYYNLINEGSESADFFNTSRDSKQIYDVNEPFKKLLRIISLLPPKLIHLIINWNLLKMFRFVPKPIIFFLGALKAIIMKDLRYRVYLRYYFLKIRRAIP